MYVCHVHMYSNIKTIHLLPHWGSQYKCYTVYYNKEILVITVTEQQKKKIQVFADVMPWLEKSHQCHTSWTAWSLKFHQSTYHNIPEDLYCRNWTSCHTEHLNPPHACGQSVGQRDSACADHLSASILSMLSSFLIHRISVANTSLNSVTFTHYMPLHFSVATGYQF